MSFKFNCENCLGRIESEDDWRGMVASCPHCGCQIIIPLNNDSKVDKQVVFKKDTRTDTPKKEAQIDTPMKQCFFCGESIPERVIVCRYCGKQVERYGEEEKILYSGHPLLYKYISFWFSLVLGCVALWGWHHDGDFPEVWFFFSIVFFIYSNIVRLFTTYTITNRVVRFQNGFLLKNIRELSIDDIRSINIINEVDLEVSSAASTGGTILFDWISSPRKKKEMIRRQKDFGHA